MNRFSRKSHKSSEAPRSHLRGFSRSGIYLLSKKILSLFIILFLFLQFKNSVYSIAQDVGTVVVSVTDAETGDAINGAQVDLDGESAQSAGSDGVLSFDRIPIGEHALRASASYYESQTSFLIVKAGETSSLAFKLKSGATDVTLNGLVVRSTDGVGIGGILIKSFPKGAASQLTNTSGEYSIPIKGLRAKTTIFIEAIFQDTQGNELTGNASFLYPGKTDQITAPDIHLEIKLPSEISGIVIDSDDQPMSGARVTGSESDDTTESNGTFLVNDKNIKLGSNVEVKARLLGADGNTYTSSPISVKFEGEPISGLVLKIPYKLNYKDIQITGGVFDQDQLGIAGAAVVVNGVQVITDGQGTYQALIPSIKLGDKIIASTQYKGNAGTPVQGQNEVIFQGSPVDGLNIYLLFARIFNDVPVWGIVYNTLGKELNAVQVQSDHGGSSTTNGWGQFSLLTSNLRKGTAIGLTATQVIEDEKKKTTFSGSTQVTFEGTEIGNIRIVLADQPSREEPILTLEEAVQLSITSFTLSQESYQPGETIVATLVYQISGLEDQQKLNLGGSISAGPFGEDALSGEIFNSSGTKVSKFNIPSGTEAGTYSVHAQLQAGSKNAFASLPIQIKAPLTPQTHVNVTIVSFAASTNVVRPGQTFDVTLVYEISGLKDGEKINMTGSITAGPLGQENMAGAIYNAQWTKKVQFSVPEFYKEGGDYTIVAQVEAGDKSASSSLPLEIQISVEISKFLNNLFFANKNQHALEET